MQSACMVSCSITANDLDIHGMSKSLVQIRDHACTLHRYISITDKVKISEQTNQ